MKRDRFLIHQDIQPLIEGYKKFREESFKTSDTPFTKLVREGQQPKILVIACSDSRVDPALLMNCEPGDLFVVRNVANLVPPYEDDLAYHGTSAALEFGICKLNIRHVIVLGHTPCGDIQALLETPLQPEGPPRFLSKWLELAQDAYEATLKDPTPRSLQEKVTVCGHHSLIHALDNLKTFPWIAEKISQDLLHLHAWNFDMIRGILEAYIAEDNCFKNLDDRT